MDSLLGKLHWKYLNLCTGRQWVIIAMVALSMYENTPMGEDSSGEEEFPYSCRNCKECTYN